MAQEGQSGGWGQQMWVLGGVARGCLPGPRVRGCAWPGWSSLPASVWGEQVLLCLWRAVVEGGVCRLPGAQTPWKGKAKSFPHVS